MAITGTGPVQEIPLHMEIGALEHVASEMQGIVSTLIERLTLVTRPTSVTNARDRDQVKLNMDGAVLTQRIYKARSAFEAEYNRLRDLLAALDV